MPEREEPDRAYPIPSSGYGIDSFVKVLSKVNIRGGVS
jgi:hypothetical protein